MKKSRFTKAKAYQPASRSGAGSHDQERVLEHGLRRNGKTLD